MNEEFEEWWKTQRTGKSAQSAAWEAWNAAYAEGYAAAKEQAAEVAVKYEGWDTNPALSIEEAIRAMEPEP